MSSKKVTTMEILFLVSLLTVSLGKAIDSENTKTNRAKRCANVWDDGCANSGVSGASDDGLYFESDSSPGKRCANVWDDGCANSGVSGASDDGLYFDSDSSPGKRRAAPSRQMIRHFLAASAQRAAASKRCANVWDDGCANSGVSGASDDGLYFSSDSSPGKRWLLPQWAHRQAANRRHPGQAASADKRCANVWDDGCANSGVSGASDDGIYFNSDSSPGK